MKTYDHKVSKIVVGFFGIFLMVYGVSSFFPDSFLWGVNHLAFLQPVDRIFPFLLAVVLGLPVISQKYINVIEKRAKLHAVTDSIFLLMVLVVGAVVAHVFYNYRIMTDMYGDTRMLVQYLSWKRYTILEIMKPENKEPLTQMFHQLVAYSFDIDIKSAYEIVSSVCGGIFIGLILIFIKRLDGSKLWKIFILILFITPGANQLFFGHAEDYTIIYLIIVLFFILGWVLFDGKQTLGVMVLIFIVGIRIHLEMFLVLPALIFAILYTRRAKHPTVEKWLTLRVIFVFIGITIICGALAYFYYFQAYRYMGTDVEEILRKLFIPIYNHLLTPHSYTMLSFAHLSDFIQELLLTISPVALLIFFLSIIFSRRINWREPRIIFFGLTVFYFLLFNFTINPALSMPRDWDFLAPAALPILFVTVSLSQKLFKDILSTSHQKNIIGVGLALGIFSYTFFYINSNPDEASHRLEGIGKWAFKSYYSSSSYILNVSAKMVENLNDQIERRKSVISDLLPNASKPDLEIGFLYHKLGVALYSNRQFNEAAFNFRKSLQQDPQNASAIKILGMIALQERNFIEAERILNFYNRNINHPKVQDPQGLELAEYCNQLKNLVSSNGDSTMVKKKLDYIFQITK